MLKKKFIIILSGFIFLCSCTSFKNAITGQKKKTGDEFFVIKKEPLTLPPDFQDLPEPDQEDNLENEVSTEVEALLKDISKNTDISPNTSKNLESSILDKIKKN